MKRILLGLLLVMLAAPLAAQSVRNPLTKPWPRYGPALPATCADGDIFDLTAQAGASSANRIYWCFQETWHSLGSAELDSPYMPNQVIEGFWEFLQAASFPANDVSLDYKWPGTAPHFLHGLRTPTWVDVPLPSTRVRVTRFRILTGARSWGFLVCPDKGVLAACKRGVLKGTSTGWSLAFGDAEADWTYVDRDSNGVPEMHLRVMPFNGDWMTVRVQLEGESY